MNNFKTIRILGYFAALALSLVIAYHSTEKVKAGGPYDDFAFSWDSASSNTGHGHMYWYSGDCGGCINGQWTPSHTIDTGYNITSIGVSSVTLNDGGEININGTMVYHQENGGRDNCWIRRYGYNGPTGLNTTVLSVSMHVVDSCGAGGGGNVDFIVYRTFPTPTVTFDPNTYSVAYGGTVTFTTYVKDANSCSVTGSWSSSFNVSNGLTYYNTTSQLTTPGTVSFTLTCSGYGGTTAVTRSISVANPPPPSVTFAPNTYSIAYGGTISFTTYVTNATSCTVTPGSYSAWGNRAFNVSNGITYVNTTSALTTPGANNFSLTCSGIGGVVTVSRTITVGGQPTVNFSAKKVPDDGTAYNNSITIPRNTNITLSWSSTNTASCNLIGSNGTADNGLPANGSLSKGPISAGLTYTISCTNGFVSPSSAIIVIIGTPTGSMQINPMNCSIAAPSTTGCNVTLQSWSTQYAPSNQAFVLIKGGIYPVAGKTVATGLSGTNITLEIPIGGATVELWGGPVGSAQLLTSSIIGSTLNQVTPTTPPTSAPASVNVQGDVHAGGNVDAGRQTYTPINLLAQTATNQITQFSDVDAVGTNQITYTNGGTGIEITGVPLAAVPCITSKAWLFDLDTERINQIRFSQSLPTNVTFNAKISWDTDIADAMQGFIGLTDTNGYFHDAVGFNDDYVTAGPSQYGSLMSMYRDYQVANPAPVCQARKYYDKVALQPNLTQNTGSANLKIVRRSNHVQLYINEVLIQEHDVQGTIAGIAIGTAGGPGYPYGKFRVETLSLQQDAISDRLTLDQSSVLTAGGQVNINGVNQTIQQYFQNYKVSSTIDWTKLKDQLVTGFNNLMGRRGQTWTGQTTTIPFSPTNTIFYLNTIGNDPTVPGNDTSKPEGGVWKVNGDLTINAPMTFYNTGTIVVSGKITITGTGSITVKDGTLGLVSMGAGGIEIAIGVKGVDGIALFAANGPITIN